MKDILISYDTAVLAQEKGFSIKTEYRFFWNSNIATKTQYTGKQTLYYAPSQSLLQRWIREVHNIDVLVYKVNDLYTTIFCSINGLYKTYEEALEEGLRKSLLKIKTNKELIK